MKRRPAAARARVDDEDTEEKQFAALMAAWNTFKASRWPGSGPV
jgi:hypothetical protein